MAEKDDELNLAISLSLEEQQRKEEYALALEVARAVSLSEVDNCAESLVTDPITEQEAVSIATALSLREYQQQQCRKPATNRSSSKGQAVWCPQRLKSPPKPKVDVEHLQGAAAAAPTAAAVNPPLFVNGMMTQSFIGDLTLLRPKRGDEFVGQIYSPLPPHRRKKKGKRFAVKSPPKPMVDVEHRQGAPAAAVDPPLYVNEMMTKSFIGDLQRSVLFNEDEQHITPPLEADDQMKKPQHNDTTQTAEQAKEDQEAKEAKEDKECAICRLDMDCSDIQVLPCAHKFHVACVGTWLEYKDICPSCRTPLDNS